MSKEKEPVIPEVIEAYKVLAKYSFDSEITTQDKNRVLELLSKVPKKSEHYDKLEIVIAALNIGVLTKGKLYFPAKPAARALKEYMINCGVDPGEIMDLHLESRDAYRKGSGAVCIG